MSEGNEEVKERKPLFKSTGQQKKAEEKSPEDYFRWGVFLTAMLLMFIAAMELYFTLDDVIRVWFEYQYVSMVKALYNIFIIVVCVYVLRLFVFRKQA